MRTEQDNNIALYSIHELLIMKDREEHKMYNPFTLDEIKAEITVKTITPYCQKLADKWVKGGYSDAYIQSQMYASRDQNTSIDHIVKAIEISKSKFTGRRIFYEGNKP